MLLATVIAVGLGCRREEVTVYTAPKDTPPKEVAHHEGDGHDHGDAQAHAHGDMAARPRPKVTWKLPAGWAETEAGQMNAAAFVIKGAGELEAQVAITPLGMLAGRESMVVNMFRQQVGLAPWSEEETAKNLQDVTVGEGKGKMFELTGKLRGADGTNRIVTVISHRPEATWFYKLSGDEVVVEAQKPAFMEFLKSIRIEASASEPTTAAAAAEPGGAGQFKWQVPGDWKAQAPGQMQAAKFSVPEKNGAKADVLVSVFPNDTGGTIANINRWRRQLGLAEADESAVRSQIKPVDGLPGAFVTDLSNEGRQLLGAIVPRGGQFWFYKLVGGAEAVGAQRDNFMQFIKSTP